MEKVINELKELLIPFIMNKKVSEKENLFDILESLELVRFVIEVENKYKIEIQPEEVCSLFVLAKKIEKRRIQ